MSIHTPASSPAKIGKPIYAFLFLTVMALGLLGCALVLGTEPRLAFERTADGTFLVTGSNHFSGGQFFTKTISGVKGVQIESAFRDNLRDSAKQKRRQRQTLHVEITGADGSRLGWDRESDRPVIETFMRGKDPTLHLSDPPPAWRMGLAWFCVVFGLLTFIAALQSFSGKPPPNLPS